MYIFIFFFHIYFINRIHFVLALCWLPWIMNPFHDEAYFKLKYIGNNLLLFLKRMNVVLEEQILKKWIPAEKVVTCGKTLNVPSHSGSQAYHDINQACSDT